MLELRSWEMRGRGDLITAAAQRGPARVEARAECPSHTTQAGCLSYGFLGRCGVVGSWLRMRRSLTITHKFGGSPGFGHVVEMVQATPQHLRRDGGSFLRSWYPPSRAIHLTASSMLAPPASALAGIYALPTWLTPHIPPAPVIASRVTPDAAWRHL